MSEDKERDALEQEEDQAADETLGTAASRARNKTVMLSPEMTGQVRAMLQDEPSASGEAAESGLDTFIPPVDEWQGANVGSADAPESEPVAPASAPVVDEGFQRPSSAGMRATSILDADSMAAMESAITGEVPVEPEVDRGGFDPMTSVVPSVSFDEPVYTPPPAEPVVEDTPQPAVEQASTGFSVNAKAASAPQVSNTPRAPRNAGPAGWHGIVTSGEPAKLVGLLVSYDTREEGEMYEIRIGRFLLTSRPTDNGDYLLIDDESVSPLHAIMRASEEGSIQVLDQLSEFGTAVWRVGAKSEEEVSGGLVSVEHGDTIRFGNRHFVVVCIPPIKKPKDK